MVLYETHFASTAADCIHQAPVLSFLDSALHVFQRQLPIEQIGERDLSLN